MADEKCQKVLYNQAEWVSLGFSAFLHFAVGWKSLWVLACCLQSAENTVTLLKTQIIAAVSGSLSNVFRWLGNPWILLFPTPCSILCSNYCFFFLAVKHSWGCGDGTQNHTGLGWQGHDFMFLSPPAYLRGGNRGPYLFLSGKTDFKRTCLKLQQRARLAWLNHKIWLSLIRNQDASQHLKVAFKILMSWQNRLVRGGIGMSHVWHFPVWRSEPAWIHSRLRHRAPRVAGMDSADAADLRINGVGF